MTGRDFIELGGNRFVRGNAGVGEIGLSDDVFAQLLMWEKLNLTLIKLNQNLTK